VLGQLSQPVSAAAESCGIIGKKAVFLAVLRSFALIF